MRWRLALIIFLGPVVTFLVSLPVLGKGAVLLVVAYPIMVVCSTLFAPVVLAYLRSGRSSQVVQAMTVSSLGFVIGAVFILLEARSTPRGIYEVLKLVIPYGGIGATHAIVLWLLSTFGPLRVVNRHSITPQGDA
jgi:hypothetical protein